ncbi:MAG: hypothetical protein O3B08_02840 [Proteobacteria bacterium]|nr:hypothetical protein [Pseudomonadota bacterium]
MWPTITNDSGYTVYIDSIAGSLHYTGIRDWKKIILEDLKKELGATLSQAGECLNSVSQGYLTVRSGQATAFPELIKS